MGWIGLARCVKPVYSVQDWAAAVVQLGLSTYACKASDQSEARGRIGRVDLERSALGFCWLLSILGGGGSERDG